MKTNPTIRGTTPEVRASAKALRWRMTTAESVLWEAPQERRLGGLKFRCQHLVGPFILDFYCPALRLVIEVDGGVHDDVEQAAYDAARAEQLEYFGNRVLRFRNEEILNDLVGVCTSILKMAVSLSSNGNGQGRAGRRAG